MCKKTKGLHNRIDPCLKPLLKWLEKRGYNVVSSCCGHSVYPMTVVVRTQWDVVGRFGDFSRKIEKEIIRGTYTELFSGKEILRCKKFYKKDKNGFYYIPEVMEATKL